MLPTPGLSRRTALMAAASLPLVAAGTKTGHAAAPMLGAGSAPFNRVKLGGFEVTTLLAGSRAVPDPQTIFGMNVDEETFNAVTKAAGLPTDQAQFFFTPTVVNTGSELVLFDTGLSADGTGAALIAAGYTPEQVDVVVITHMHGDHIGGLTRNGTPAYPNARYVTGRVEFDAWASRENEGFEAQVRPLAEQFTFIEGGEDVVGGINAIAAFGHTPGHMVYRIESDGKSLIIGADFTNHYIWSLAHPDWEVRFDMDKSAAAATRKQLLDMIATDKLPFIGYHMPWPGIGYVDKKDGAYAYVPHSYQLLL